MMEPASLVDRGAFTRAATMAALVLCAAAAPAPASAQPSDEFQQWAAVFTNVRLSKDEPRGMLWLDTHARRGAGQTTVLLRPGVGLQLAPWISIWAGYAWIPRVQDEGADSNEHRSWQQATLTYQAPWNLVLISRTRFEQRFSDAGDDVGFRIRQFVRAKWQPDESVGVGLTLWDELFVGFNSTDWGAVDGFDQNRLFVGPFLPLQEWGRFELGYLWVSLRRAGTGFSQHVLAANLFMSFGGE